MQIEIFRGTTANVNSFLLIGDEEVFLIDTLRNAAETANLAHFIRMTGKPLRHVLVTHGHPDHFMGLHMLRTHFPKASFLVAREGIKVDIMRYSLEMERNGWLDGNPALYPFEGDPGMKGLCPANLSGFDYEKELVILPSNRMRLAEGTELQFTTLYKPTECDHMTVVYVPVVKALFTADLVYNKMFPWLGEGVEREHVQNWVTALKQLQATYLEDDPLVYPGHGEPGGLDLLEAQVAFLDDFLSVIDRAPTEHEAMTSLILKYPNYYQREFILPSSVINFMRKEGSGENREFGRVYMLGSNGNERFNGGVRKVL